LAKSPCILQGETGWLWTANTATQSRVFWLSCDRHQLVPKKPGTAPLIGGCFVSVDARERVSAEERRVFAYLSLLGIFGVTLAEVQMQKIARKVGGQPRIDPADRDKTAIEEHIKGLRYLALFENGGAFRNPERSRAPNNIIELGIVHGTEDRQRLDETAMERRHTILQGQEKSWLISRARK
jgi:hypothetical protein